MKRSAAALLLAGIGVLGGPFLAAGPSGQTDGRSVFEGQKCNQCHNVPTARIRATSRSRALKGPNLVNLDERYTAGELSSYLTAEANRDGKTHPRGFKGSDEELHGLVDWLLEQKRR